MKTMSCSVVLALLLLVTPVAHGDAKGTVASIKWAKALGGKGRDEGRGVAVGPKGNVFVTGRLRDEGDLGGGARKTAARGTGAILASYTGEGAHRWAKVFGGGRTTGFGVAVSDKGAVAITGMNGGNLSLDGTVTLKPTNLDAFVAVFEADGTHRWSRGFGGAGDDVGVTITFDTRGDVIVAGTYLGPVTPGNAKLRDSDSIDVFLAKYGGADGKPVWSQALSGPGTDGICRGGHYLSVASNNSGGIVLTGPFEDKLSIGATTLQSKEESDGFIASFDADGKPAWATSFGGAQDDVPHGLALDANGDVLVCGGFQGQADFGGGVLTSLAMNDVFVAKYAGASGKHVWSKRYGGGTPKTGPMASMRFPTQAEHGAAIAVDAKGQVVLTGVLGSASDLGAGPIASDGRLDPFLLVLSADGKAVRGARLGGPGSDRARGMALLPGGDVVLVGSMEKVWPASGGAELASTGREDLLLVRATP